MRRWTISATSSNVAAWWTTSCQVNRSVSHPFARCGPVPPAVLGHGLERGVPPPAVGLDDDPRRRMSEVDGAADAVVPGWPLLADEAGQADRGERLTDQPLEADPSNGSAANSS